MIPFTPYDRCHWFSFTLGYAAPNYEPDDFPITQWHDFVRVKFFHLYCAFFTGVALCRLCAVKNMSAECRKR